MKSDKITKTINLTDGTAILIRPIQPTDAEIEWKFVHDLSHESRYFRFRSALRDLTPKMVEYFTNIDLDTHMALIAVVNRDGRDIEVAVGRYFRYETGRICEFAIVVADEWQGKGIGRQIMQMLIENARDRGIEIMEGEILALNNSMLKLLKKLDFVLLPDPEDHKIVKASLQLQKAPTTAFF